MRKIVVFNLISADGYFAGTDGNLDWQVVDPEFDNWAAKTIEEYDTALFGRITYELFAGYWPGAISDPKTSSQDWVIAKALDKMTKIVFSSSLKGAKWRNSRIAGQIDRQAVQDLKEQPGKSIVVYGSGTLVTQLTELSLIDEYRFMVNPVVLGDGRRMFGQINTELKLKLLSSKSFSSGNVLLTYEI